MARIWAQLDQGGPDVLLDTEDILVTFFIPLPEFLRFPDDRPFPTYRQFEPALTHWLKEFEDIPAREPEPGQDPNFVNLVGGVLLAASVVFRRHATNFLEASELPLMASMFKEHTPLSESHSRILSEAGASPGGNTFFRSVAEVTVSLDAVSFKMHLEHGSTIDRLRDKSSITEKIVSDALDVALTSIQSLQAAYYGAIRTPLTIIEREILPPALLYSLRTLVEINSSEPVDLLFLPTMNPPSGIGLESEMTAEEMARVGSVINSFSPLTRYLDLYRQGSLALQKGSTRESVVMIAVAAESLIDVFLAHLQWEECVTPEESAVSWRSSLKERVKKDFHERLGGSWSVSVPGPMQDWDKKVAGIRHRVVHAGYRPTLEEARGAVDALNALVTFLGDRVSYGRNLSKYLRTAVRLVGVDGLERRGRNTRAIQERVRDSDDINWDDTFSRWYETQTRCRRDQENPRASELERCEYYLVFTSPQDTYWVASDWVTRQAAKVQVVLIEGAGDPAQQISQSAQFANPADIIFPISAQMVEGSIAQVERVGDWLEDYRLLPLRGVMCDSSDFAHREIADRR